MRTAVVLGVGPALGLSVARRFGREGYRVAIVSRSAERHPRYLAQLAADGIDAAAFVADVLDGEQLTGVLTAIEERLGPSDVVYFGPSAFGSVPPVKPVTELDVTDLWPMEHMLGPAIRLVRQVLPGMRDREGGSLLFAGGASGAVPMPALGNLGPASAAYRNYVLTLNAALAGTGIYVGTLTIGGLIRGGDVEQAYRAQSHAIEPGTLDPDELAEELWGLHTRRDSPEHVALSAALTPA